MNRILMAEPDINQQDIDCVMDAVKSGWISGRGPYVEKFEKAFAKWLGSKYAVTTSSGTTALHLALASLDVGRGDEIIIPAFSMGAIPFAVSQTGARIVLVDSELETWNAGFRNISRKFTNATKAIIVMHGYGHPASMKELLDYIADFNKHADLIFIIEDAAEAHGAEIKGKKVGAIGHIGCFSFFANKIITTGEGGMLTTNHINIADKSRRLKDMAFGSTPETKFLHTDIGYNYRMTNIQAALGYSQLQRIDRFIEYRRNNAKLYNDLLVNVKGITLPPEQSWAKNVYWLYSILINKQFPISRDELIKRLRAKGIDSRPFFTPIHKQPIYQDLITGSYPIAEMLGECGLNLPLGNTLKESEVAYIANILKRVSK